MDIGILAVHVEHSPVLLTLCYLITHGRERQSDRMESDMEVCMKQRCELELLHVDRIAPLTFTDTSRNLMESKQ